MSLEGQLDIFAGATTPAPVAPPEDKIILLTPTKCPSPAAAKPSSSNSETCAPNGTEPLVFDARGMYANAETLAKLDEALSKLQPGDVWKNSNGVPSRYLGRTRTNHLLHVDVKGRHIYIRHSLDTSPVKCYQSPFSKGDPMYTLDPDAHKGGMPSYSPASWYEHNGQTWTGRGRKPLWVATYIEQGGKLEDILKTIKKAH